jgi:uncharacterized protein
MALKQQISEHMKDAMRAKDVARLSAIRLLLAAIKQREIDERIELSDSDVMSVIEKMLKQRRDSISQFAAAGRQDLVDKETFEVGVLQSYLPKPLSESELDEEISRALQSSGAKSMQDMGKVMAILKPRLAGRADMTRVSALIKSKLVG